MSYLRYWSSHLKYTGIPVALDMDYSGLGLGGLFLGTFLSATIIPFLSDLVLIGFYEAGYPIIPSLLIATLGNLLGGSTNYFIGYGASRSKLQTKYRLTEKKLNWWKQKMDRWGLYLGLIAWVPIIGEPMTMTLGFFRIPFWPLICMMLIGKFSRYCIVTLIYLS